METPHEYPRQSRVLGALERRKGRSGRMRAKNKQKTVADACIPYIICRRKKIEDSPPGLW